MSNQPDTDHVRLTFFDLGFQYYVAGRFAASEGVAMSPVSGTLFHHAIEMFLKGELTNHLTEGQRIGLKHRLKLTWNKFKAHIEGGPALSIFDQVIDELDKFEDIRYPEKIVSEGMTCSIGFGQRNPNPMKTSSRSPRYELFVGELDALVKAILDKSGVNPSFFTRRYQKHGRTYLRRYNRSKRTRLW
jgi:hypothetical protein